ncbi:TPA: IS3 family transposase, partial [Staphylococcus delphini]|nr:IS3 family transposase [Staphylococcus delphini]
MSFIKKLTVNEYLRIFEDYEKGYSFQFIIDSLNIDINAQTLSYKYRDYKAHGIDVLLPNTKRKHYPKELKL